MLQHWCCRQNILHNCDNKKTIFGKFGTPEILFLAVVWPNLAKKNSSDKLHIFISERSIFLLKMFSYVSPLWRYTTSVCQVYVRVSVIQRKNQFSPSWFKLLMVSLQNWVPYEKNIKHSPNQCKYCRSYGPCFENLQFFNFFNF